MRLSGWLFMLASWGTMLGLFVFALVRVLRQKRRG